MTEKEELQEKYKSLYGKKAFAGWDEEKLKELIAEKESAESDERPEFEIDPDKTYVFKLVGEHAPVSFYPSTMKTYDEFTKRSRQIRVCSIEESPYVDEQADDAEEDFKPIIFTEGELRISGKDANRIKYLLATDSIKGKGKTLPENQHLVNRFELEDKSALIKLKLQREDDEVEAKQLVKKASQEDLRNYLRSVYLLAVDTMSDDEILLEAAIKAKQDPTNWLKDFNNPLHKIKGGIQKLFAKGELDDSNGAIKWRKTGGVILNYDEKLGVRSDEVLAKWALIDSKEAKDFKQTMDSKL